ncbi:MAG: Gfo/Idh/MocA family oxidoreductase [Candidatus Omnitrophota bacterium]|nr:MAG: Gfo/Idh/MocA family oxidoreductase [Candidatus Omnitrophota bacterium]
MAKINVGVVGVGYLGSRHARVYSQLKSANLVCVCDIDKKRAKKVAKKHRVWYLPDYRTLFDKVDAVSISVPTNLHYRIAKDFLNNGIHVLIEKPITNTIDEAQELIDIADSKKLTLQVGHIERFNPVVRAVEPLIKNARFIECHRAGPYKKKKRVKDVGVVLDLMIHDIDIILSLVKSEVKSIEAVGISTISLHEDIANVRLNFKNGTIADITASRVTKEEVRQIKISQKDIYITLNYLHQDAFIVRKAGDKVLKEKLKIEKKEPLKQELKSFIASIQNNIRPIVSGKEGKMALGVALDILEKIKSSKK